MKKTWIVVVFIFFMGSSIFFPMPNHTSSQNQFNNESFLVYTSNESFQQIHPSIKIALKEGWITDWNWFPRNSIIEVSGEAARIKSLFRSVPSSLIPNYSLQADPIVKHSANDALPPKNWNIVDLELQSLWAQGYTGKNVKIGVLDTGCDGSHPQLKGKIRDFAIIDRNGEASISNVYYDTDNHGTHVAGIAVGGSPDKPLGVAPEADLSVAVVIPGGSGTFSQIIGGIEWAMDPDGNPETQDAPIALNLSLGMPGFVDFWTPVFTNALNHNILIVSSSGNEGNGITNSPGNHPYVVGVGSYAYNRIPSTFSAGDDNIVWETSSILAGPYVKPDISAPGSMVYSSVPGNSYEYFSGTSMAAPHVTGAVAILKQVFPLATAWDLRNFLLWGSEDLGKEGWDTRFGQGVLNIQQSIDKAHQSKRIEGSIQHYTRDYHLWIPSLESGIYVGPDGYFSCHLLPGTYQIEIRKGTSVVQTHQIIVKNENKPVELSLPNPTMMNLEGVVLGSNGRAIPDAKIVYGEMVYFTDDQGHFSVPLQQGEQIIIRKSGYIEKRLKAELHENWINVRLEKTSLLLIEGQSPYSTIINPPKLALPIYEDALHQLGYSYALIRSSEESFSYDDIKDYSKIVLFYANGGMQNQDISACSKYLDNGGNLILSGRMVMLIEQFYQTDFLSEYAGVYSKKMIAFPSVEGIHSSYEELQFPLSGSGGANNQETCDVLIQETNSRNIPILKYSSTSDKEYAGVLSNTSAYKMAFLGFGLEGIGIESSRIELLRRLLDWTDQGGKIQINLPQGKTYITMKRNHEIVEKITEETNVSFHNLFLEKYEFTLEQYGKKKIFFEADFSKGDSYISNAFFKESELQRVEIQPKNCDAPEAYLMVYYKDTLLSSEKINPTESITKDLPQGDYLFSISAKGFKNQYYKLSIQASEEEPRIAEMKMEKTTIHTLVIDDSPTGWYLLDHYLGIGSYSTRWLETSGITFQHWSVEEKGFPSFHQMFPYDVVIDIAGRNAAALYTKDRQESIGQYLDGGGKFMILSNSAHTVLDQSEWFSNYFGLQIENINVREKTVIGIPNTATESMYFDIYNSLEQDGFYITYPAFETTSSHSKSILQYASGKLCANFHDNGTFRCIYLPFGLDNLTNSDIRIKLVKTMLKMLETGEIQP
ncbi:MAG TPA: S8 family serine peptidase [Caldisericia bacterium]|nr:S8 family serine peptidase [Caldisericia bacterium]